ncbi:hypothetical protein [Anabaena sp. CA = ATCC 33047]|uniref:hypothetical protein n=1 Tax=Anabaena sp. (strain CA / ATCC 33047) TaxID=52271 RepID=UPI0018DDC86C|nr:hypothetical protein [Anabaena sp. CA = ATCC 33047]
MKQIIHYPLMTVVLIGVVGDTAIAQLDSRKTQKQQSALQQLAALETNTLVAVAQTTPKIDQKTALNLVWKLPLVQRKAREIQRLSQGKIKVSAIVDSVPTPTQPYYTVRIFEDDPNNYNYTIYWFRVSSSTGVIEALDIIENKYVALEEWRSQIRRRR